MTRVEKIREFIYDITHGILNITEQQARTIMNITDEFKGGTVVMYRYDSNNSAWIKFRSISVEDYFIDRQLEKYKDSLNYQFYKFECTYSTGIFAGIIFTSNNNVF